MKKYLHKQPVKLESGVTLPEVEIAYHTIGNLNSSGDNVVWIFHALTANSDATEWWKGLVGESDLINPKKHFIVCANVLGSAYGTTGPLSVNPKSGIPYYHDFPFVTIRDLVKVHDLLRQHLRLNKIYLGIGGSLGGQQLLDWSISQPDLFTNICLIATNARHSPWGIAFNEAQRMAIESDATWQEKKIDAGVDGLRAARSIALLSYRHYDAYLNSQSEVNDDVIDQFKAAGYQKHQGKKLSDRFNAFSYYILSKAMDTHHAGRERGGVEAALALIKARALIVGIQSDLLFPISEQKLIANLIKESEIVLIDSDFGHDGFLVETKKLSQIIGDFLEKETSEQYKGFGSDSLSIFNINRYE